MTDPILEALLATKRAPDKIAGICTMVRINSDYTGRDAAKEGLIQSFRKWPEYSGSDKYPVPAPADYNPSAHFWQDAYHSCPRGEGEYGKARKRLLDFLIKLRREELKA